MYIRKYLYKINKNKYIFLFYILSRKNARPIFALRGDKKDTPTVSRGGAPYGLVAKN